MCFSAWDFSRFCSILSLVHWEGFSCFSFWNTSRERTKLHKGEHLVLVSFWSYGEPQWEGYENSLTGSGALF